MRSNYYDENFLEVEEGFADNTQVLSISLTKNTEKLSSNNQLGLSLYLTLSDHR